MTESFPWSWVDAHQHNWRLADTQWPTPDLVPIYRDFTPEDFLQAAGDRVASVLIQSQPTEADTRYLLDLAHRCRHILGVVGWVDLAGADAGERLRYFAGDALFKGVRPMLQNLPDERWILQPSIAPALEVMSELGLCFDALIYPGHLPYIRELAERHPGLRIVLDHGAKPDIAGGDWSGWYGMMAGVASCDNIYCKLSGLITEAGPEADLSCTEAYARAIIELFGPHRVLWGSDWPVVNLASDYCHWHEFAKKLVNSVDPSAEKAVFCDNSVEFYGLI